LNKKNAKKAADQLEERRRAISEAFHSFHQPLTSLHCGLEITLLKPRSVDEYKSRLQDALIHAGAILRLNRVLRELVEAGDPGEQFGIVSLALLLRQMAEDVAYIAEPALVKIAVGKIVDVEIRADQTKLLKMLSHVLASMIGRLLPGGVVKVATRMNGTLAEIRMSAEGSLRDPDALNPLDTKAQAIGWDATNVYVQTLGGSMNETDHVLELSLPIVS
jgi:hypothetical protein